MIRRAKVCLHHILLLRASWLNPIHESSTHLVIGMITSILVHMRIQATGVSTINVVITPQRAVSPKTRDKLRRINYENSVSRISARRCNFHASFFTLLTSPPLPCHPHMMINPCTVTRKLANRCRKLTANTLSAASASTCLTSVCKRAHLNIKTSANHQSVSHHG